MERILAQVGENSKGGLTPPRFGRAGARGIGQGPVIMIASSSEACEDALPTLARRSRNQTGTFRGTPGGFGQT